MEIDNITDDYIARNCACFNVRKAARAVTQLYDSQLKPTGLRGTQFTLLIALSKLKTVGISQLADILVLERTTLTRNLRPLQKQGLVFVAEGTDRRTRSVEITKAGRLKLQQSIPYWEKAQKLIAEGLGKDDLDLLIGLVKKTTELTREI